MGREKKGGPIRTEFMAVLLDIQSRLGTIEANTLNIKETVEHHRKDAKAHIVSDENTFKALGIELQNIDDKLDSKIDEHAADDKNTFVWIKRALVALFAVLFIDLMGFRELSQSIVLNAGKAITKYFFHL